MSSVTLSPAADNTIGSSSRPRPAASPAAKPAPSPTDDDFIRHLTDRFGRLLFSFVFGLTKDRDWTEDVVQMTLIRAWRSRDRLAEAGDGAGSWLFTVARRILIDDYRARSARPVVLAADLHAAEPADEIDRLVLTLAIDQALASLTEAHREAVRSCLQDRTPAETAKILGIPEGTVKSRTHYGMRALKKALDGPLPAAPAAAA